MGRDYSIGEENYGSRLDKWFKEDLEIMRGILD